MEHSHSYNRTNYLGKAFKIGISLNIIYIIIEVFAGIRSNSMALIADAGHNFSDVLVLAFSWIAIALSQRKPTMKFTYGLRRSTILVALFNTLFLLAAVIFIIIESVGRFKHPAEIESHIVIFTALAGLIINGITAWFFKKDQKRDLNIRSAFIHFIADALVSLGVVAAGIIMIFTGITWIDSIVSLLIVAVILYSSYKLLINSVNLALDAVPENIDINAVRKYLEEIPHVTGIHDLHIWALSTTDAAITVHLTTDIQTESDFISEIQNYLDNKFAIGHSTIQVEFGESPAGCKNCN
jgi:cation diffusion facilitator family transporter